MISYKFRKFVLDAVKDSPLEHFLRASYTRISPAKADKYDRQMLQLMKRVMSRHSVGVDVGCYRGEVLREMIKLSPNGSHFAIEPVPQNYQFIARKFGTASVFNIALSDYTGEATFYHVVDRSALSGLQRVAYPDEKQEVNEIKVKVDCLDNVIPDNVRIDFLKIDVEGGELLVLRGGRKVIKASRPVIVFEHGWKRAAVYNNTPEQMYELLTAEFGLNVSILDRWLDEQGPFSEDEFYRHVYDGLNFCFVAYP